MIRPLLRDPPRALRRVVLFGGGSGGHLMPGLAVVEEIRARHPDCRVTLFRTRREIESRVLERAAFDGALETQLVTLDPPRDPLRFARQCAAAVSGIRRYLARTDVDAAVGLGGYPSIPGVLAARIEGVPVILLEQNATPGKVNRLLGPLAAWIACPSGAAVESFGVWRHLSRPVDTGNPLRSSVVRARAWRRRRAPAVRRGDVGASGRRVLVVLGGSQGAHAINRAVVNGLLAAPEYRQKVFCVHVTGNADKGWAEDAYRQAGWMAKVVAFEHDLPAWMAAADLVVARAGGSTVAELAAIGVPSILIPYPGHGDRHQYRNALALEARGAALLVAEEELERGGVRQVLEILYEDAKLDALSRRALDVARIDGAERVLELLEDVVEAESANV